MKRILGLAGALVLSHQLLHGAVTLVTDRDQLGGNDVIQWGDFPKGSYPLAPLTITSAGGSVTATLTGETPGGFWRLDQGNGWDGNFPAGDALLVNLWLNDLTIEFSTPVKAAGTQMQHWQYGPFTASLRAFASDGDLLGWFFVNGYSGHPTDPEAVFVGVSSEAAEISRIVLSTVEIEEFAINAISVQAIPEPSSGIMLAAGVLWITSRRFCKRLNSSN